MNLSYHHMCFGSRSKSPFCFDFDTDIISILGTSSFLLFQYLWSSGGPSKGCISESLANIRFVEVCDETTGYLRRRTDTYRMDEPLCFKGLESLTLHEETETGWYNETSIEELTEFISRRFEESRKKERTTLGKEPP